MNRPYDRAKYLDLIGYARKVMPDLVLTSDVIIGFPGETEAEAMETVDLVRQVEFDALFTFIFSPRPGTPGGQNGRPRSPGGKAEMVRYAVQYAKRDIRPASCPVCRPDPAVLVDGETDDARWPLSARTAGDGWCTWWAAGTPGQYRNVRITDSNTWALFGGDGIIPPIERSFALFNNVFHYHSTDTPHMRQKARVKPWRS